MDIESNLTSIDKQITPVYNKLKDNTLDYDDHEKIKDACFDVSLKLKKIGRYIDNLINSCGNYKLTISLSLMNYKNTISTLSYKLKKVTTFVSSTETNHDFI